MSLFVEGSYDVLEFSMAPNGMNQNISAKVLPPNFAHVLENILPDPQGRGSVRFGNELINDELPPDSKILEEFAFIKSDGNKQVVLYVQEFTEDLPIEEAPTIIDGKTFTFQSDHAPKFVLNAPIKITYTGPLGIITLYSTIADLIVEEGINVTITLAEDNIFPSNFEDLTITHVYYAVGSIYSFDFASETLSAQLMTGLSVTTVPRSCPFPDVIIIYNGIDKLMSWNGTTLEVIIDFVKEIGTNFNWIDATHFSFLTPENFIIEKYFDQAQIRLSINGTVTSTTVASIMQPIDIATIATEDPIPEFTGEDEVILYYGDYPPPFSYLYPAHDRIFALAPGAISLKYRDPEEALKVFFTNQPNSYTAWYDELTKHVLFEDLSAKHGVADNLEAICMVNELLIFIGRHKTQIWQGSDPSPNADPRNEFEWLYNLPIGIAHGNLLVPLPNDVYFVTENGIVSFNTLNIARQLVASPSDAVDPIVRQYVKTITESDLNYWACRSFKYKSGPFVGFKIGKNKLLVSLYSANLYAWAFFTGDFSKASCFCGDLDNSLYLGIDNKIYKYADGKDSSVIIYGDQDGESAIPFYWMLPVVHQSGRRYANKRYEIQFDYPSSFFINPDNSIFISIFGDIRKTFSLENEYELSPRGDPFNTIPLLKTAIDPNKPSKYAIGMRLGIPYESIKGRLKFISSSFWLNISGYCKDGPVYFDRVRLFGIFERSS